MFTQYKISQALIEAEAARVAAAVEAMSPGADAATYAAHVIAARLREHPQRYLEFGPWWWAVKSALAGSGEDFGAAEDAVVMAGYGEGLTLLQCLAAGELFKDYYRRTFLAGSVQFWLDDGAEESYVLFDPDMEARRLGKAGLLVSANLNAVAMPDEPENTPADLPAAGAP